MLELLAGRSFSASVFGCTSNIALPQGLKIGVAETLKLFSQIIAAPRKGKIDYRGNGRLFFKISFHLGEDFKPF